MRSSTTIPFLIRRALLAFVIITAFALLSGPAGLKPEPRSAEATFLSEVKILLSSDPDPGIFDAFGAVSLSGDTAVVGGYNLDAAYVFQRDLGGPGNWGELTTLVSSDMGAGDRFGVSVAVSGDIAIVGARDEDSGGSSSGAAYVFQRDLGGADNWGQLKKLVASDAGAGDRFGTGLAFDGDTAVVGADGPEAAYVFQRDEGGPDNWGEVKILTASDGEEFDNFGDGVYLSGDYVVVGAWREGAGGFNAGAAYIFQRDQGGADNWGELKKLVASDPEPHDYFGISVAIGGDIVVIGAQLAGGLVDISGGAAYIFQRDQGGADNWGELTKLISSDNEDNDRFGQNLAVNGDTLVVGARQENAGGTMAGAAYLFQRDWGGQDNWGQVKKLTASDARRKNYFGGSVAVSGDTALIGAGGNNPEVTRGSAYVFEPPPPKAPDADTDGDTITNSIDLDDDNDGCSDLQEKGSDETLGGQRDGHNPWDFYDVRGPDQSLTTDGVIDLPNDILGVVQHHPSGTLGYDAQFDRGPWNGSNSWNGTQGPDGVIDLPNDILGVILQFGHRCV